MRKRSGVICLLAVSGAKNAGKTTLIEQLIPLLTARGYRVATVKHDGHEFEGDTPGTDSFRHKRAGAYGTAVFCCGRFQVVKDVERGPHESLLIGMFPEADILLLEGFKQSDYPKIEVIRRETGCGSVTREDTVLAYFGDASAGENGRAPAFGYSDLGKLADFVQDYIESFRALNTAADTVLTVGVIAGGQGRRMLPATKALLKFADGASLLEKTLTMAAPLGTRLLSVDRPGRFPLPPDVREVIDLIPDVGPLGGVYSVLASASTEWVLILPCDTPLVDEAFCRRLLSCCKESVDAVVPVTSDGRRHPLCAIYRRSLAQAAYRNIQAGHLRMSEFLQHSRVYEYSLSCEGIPDKTLTNINTPEEYADLLSRLC